MTAKERLNEAVEAMRNLRAMSAAEWRHYADFSAAVDKSPLTPGGDPWNSRLAAMNSELNLRLAEMLLCLTPTNL